jgi:hypothetical protein
MPYMNSSIADVGTIFDLSLNHTNILGQDWIIAAAILIIITIIVSRDPQKWLVTPLVAMLGLAAIDVKFNIPFYVLAIMAYVAGTITWTRISQTLDVVSTAAKESTMQHATNAERKLLANQQLGILGKQTTGISGILNRQAMERSAILKDKAKYGMLLSDQTAKAAAEKEAQLNLQENLRIQARNTILNPSKKVDINEGGYVDLAEAQRQTFRNNNKMTGNKELETFNKALNNERYMQIAQGVKMRKNPPIDIPRETNYGRFLIEKAFREKEAQNKYYAQGNKGFLQAIDARYVDKLQDDFSKIYKGAQHEIKEELKQKKKLYIKHKNQDIY